jgi:hypothetical protein
MQEPAAGNTIVLADRSLPVHCASAAEGEGVKHQAGSTDNNQPKAAAIAAETAAVAAAAAADDNMGDNNVGNDDVGVNGREGWC